MKNSDVIAKAVNDTNKPDMVIIDGNVYDVTLYLKYAVNRVYFLNPDGSSNVTATPTSLMFLDENLTRLLAEKTGSDITHSLLSIFSLNDEKIIVNCFNKLFYAGVLPSSDTSSNVKCITTNYILMGTSGVLFCLLLFKFLLALFHRFQEPSENKQKDVIILVPCYTEGKQELYETYRSLALTNYHDKSKTILTICDGNLTGKGNTQSVPNIVLDIMGYSGDEPEAVAYCCSGGGTNMAKVYAGYFALEEHVVPYVVIVKVGNPGETVKPGNRGKRDSQVYMCI